MIFALDLKIAIFGMLIQRLQSDSLVRQEIGLLNSFADSIHNSIAVLIFSNADSKP